MLGVVASSALADKPNIIFMLTDDQGWGDVGYNGHPKIKTPALDAMAANGLRFDRFYAAASVCSPTRATCLNGRNNWRVNITSPTSHGEAHLPAEEITIPEAIRDKGYISAHVGKWHIGGFDKGRSGTHVMTPGMAGFDYWFSTYNVLPTFDPYNKLVKGGLLDMYFDNGRNIPFEEAQKDPTMRGCDAAIVMNKSMDWIRKQAAAKKPFMICIWFHNVHTPLGKNPELMAQYSDCDPQEQVYYSNITAIDIQVGRLRDELRKLDIADNTMLWFASDNGPNLKERKVVKTADAQDGKFTYTPIGSTGAYKGWKRHLHEGGVRVPGILEWPAKIKTARATDYPAVTSDYFPTVLDALDIEMPTDRDYDGISLMPLIEGKTEQREEGIGFYSNGWHAWTEQRYKIVRQIKKGDGEWQLYDMQKDPYEETNLAADKPEILQQLAKKYDAWSVSVNKDLSKVMAKYYPPGSKQARKEKKQKEKQK
jgi:arylsulfatase A-like enzyme